MSWAGGQGPAAVSMLHGCRGLGWALPVILARFCGSLECSNCGPYILPHCVLEPVNPFSLPLVLPQCLPSRLSPGVVSMAHLQGESSPPSLPSAPNTAGWLPPLVWEQPLRPAHMGRKLRLSSALGISSHFPSDPWPPHLAGNTI